MGLKVIGAGFGRTGTMSLKLALEQLGFGPCFHMTELFRAPNSAELLQRWVGVAFGPDRPDWDVVFEGYRATVDWPAASLWRQLADHYPSARVILTVRDPDRWYASAAATIFSGSTSPDKVAERTDDWARMVHRIVGEGTFGGQAGDREHAIAVFNRHNEMVRATIPPNRLLVYETGEGWAPLCAFLGVPVPDAPYPLENTTGTFQARREAEAASAGGAG